MSAGELAEANALRGKAHEWMASLGAAGVSKRAIVSAVQLALIEMLLMERGKNGALDWLNGQIVLVAQHGDDLTRELKS